MLPAETVFGAQPLAAILKSVRFAPLPENDAAVTIPVNAPLPFKPIVTAVPTLSPPSAVTTPLTLASPSTTNAPVTESVAIPIFSNVYSSAMAERLILPNRLQALSRV